MQDGKDYLHIWNEWTPQAIECYLIGCDCVQCSVYKLLEAECFMYKAVAELLRTKGKPKRLECKYFPDMNDEEELVMDAIIEKGCRTKQEICEITGFNGPKVQYTLGRLYVIAGTNGCKYEPAQNKLAKFLHFVIKKFTGKEEEIEVKKEIDFKKFLALHKKENVYKKKRVQVFIGSNY